MPVLAHIICLVCALITVAAAQESLESPAETIDKCLQDLQSPDHHIRRAAALVIGKYDYPEARAALLRCLSDPERDIRQSALVSLTEESNNLSPEIGLAILQLLNDPDVHIRRIASSLLDNVAQARTSNLGLTVVKGKIVRRPPPAPILTPEVLSQALNQALGDRDRSVRRNVLLKARYFPGLLQSTRLLPFLQDKATEIVVLALQALRQAAGEESTLRPEIRALLHHPQTTVRLELLQYLSQAGELGWPELEKLADDSQPGIRLGALRHLADTGNPVCFPRLREALLDSELPAALRLPLLNSLRRYGQDALPTFQAVLNSEAQSLRAAAIRHLAQQNPGAVPLSVFLGALEDSQSEVRHFASQALQRQKDAVSDGQIRELLRNPYPEIRILALRLASRDSALAGELSEQFLLDENPAVRVAALQHLASRGGQDSWEILLLSLEDENPQIRDCAAGLLQAQVGQPQVAAALRKYLPLCQNEILQQRLLRLLQAPPPRQPGTPPPPQIRRRPAGSK